MSTGIDFNDTMKMSMGMCMVALLGSMFTQQSGDGDGGDGDGDGSGGIDLTAALAGVVEDSQSGLLVAQAPVSINGDIVTTNNNGIYSISPLAPGTYLIECNIEGYAPFSQQVTLIAGNNVFNIILNPASSANAEFKYDSAISFTEESATTGKRVNVSVAIKNIGTSSGVATARAIIYNVMGYGDDMYQGNPVQANLGTRTINPGESVIFEGYGLIQREATVSEILVESEAGTISYVIGFGAELKSVSIPQSIPSESDYWAEMVLHLPELSNIGIYADLVLIGRQLGMNFSDISTYAIKSLIMPPAMIASHRSYNYAGAGDYTVKGIWYQNPDSPNSEQIQRQARATYQFTQQGTSINIDKALPPGVYEVWARIRWVKVIPPNGFSQSGTLITKRVGSVIIEAPPGLPSGIYNFPQSTGTDAGAVLPLSATIRNGSPEDRTFSVRWYTDIPYVQGSEQTLNIPANSEVTSNYNLQVPPNWPSYASSMRVFCRMIEGSTIVQAQYVDIAITPNLPAGQFVCPNCGEVLYSEQAYHDHMAQHTGGYYCEICGAGPFMTAAEYYAHKAEAHPVVPNQVSPLVVNAMNMAINVMMLNVMTATMGNFIPYTFGAAAASSRSKLPKGSSQSKSSGTRIKYSSIREEYDDQSVKYRKLRFAMEQTEVSLRSERKRRAELMRDYGLSVIPPTALLQTKYRPLFLVDRDLQINEKKYASMEVTKLRKQKRLKELEIALGIRPRSQMYED